MRVSLYGSVDEVFGVLGELGIETLQKCRGVIVNGYKYYIEEAEAIQTEVHDCEFSPSRETLNVVMFVEKFKSQEEAVAEDAVRKAKESLGAAEATLKKIKEKK
jgi:hypothetical protein